ncbi:uncharacterized protein LOC121051911 [Rosa chinensis]|uniref:uncharacterized protein LOC121051911 n=1 Tax=Rosa chinensis TaxID=74649 RepID=UPI001AD8B4C9|nr:uncharacterized protein LOC121051911 [Rosa chinensis]
MEKIVQLKLEENIDVDVENILSYLPRELQNYIKSWIQKIEEKGQAVDRWLFENGIHKHKRSEIMKKVQQELEKDRDVAVENILSILSRELQNYIKTCIQKKENKGQEVDKWLYTNGIHIRNKSKIMEKVQQELQEDKDVDVEDILSILPPALQSYITDRIKKLEAKDQQVHFWLSKNRIPMRTKSEIMEKVRQELQEDRDVDVENVLSILSDKLQSYITKFLQTIDEKDRDLDLWFSKNAISKQIRSEIIKKVQQELQEDKDVDVENMLSIFPPKLQRYIAGCVQKMEDKSLAVQLWLCEHAIPLHKSSEIMEKVRQELQEDKDVDVQNILSILPPALQNYITDRIKKLEAKDQQVHFWLSKNHIPMRTKSEIMEKVRQELQEDRDVDVENVLSLLPDKLQSYITKFLQTIDEKDRDLDLWFSKNAISKQIRSEIIKKVQQELQEDKDVDVENMLSIFPPKLQRYIAGCVQKMEDKSRAVHLWSCEHAIPLHKSSEIMEKVRQELQEDKDVDVQNILSILPPALQSYITDRIKKLEAKDQQVHLWLSKNRIPMRTKSEIMEKVRQELQEDRHVDVENVLSILPDKLQSYIKKFLQTIDEKDRDLDLWFSKNAISKQIRSEIIKKVQQELQEDKDVDVENMLSIFPPKLQRYIAGCVQKMEDKSRAVHLWSCEHAIPLHKSSEIMEKVRQELQEDKDVDVQNIFSILPPALQSYITDRIKKLEAKDQQVHFWLSKNRIPMRTKSEIMEKVRQELQEGRDVDVENVLSVLPPELQTYINEFLQKIEEKVTEVDFWLFQNGIPMHNRSEIVEKVRQEHQLEKDVDVENMLSIFPPKLRKQIKTCMQRMEDKGEEVHKWLSQNCLPMHKESDIMEKVRQQLQEDRDIDVNNILSILPLKLQSYFQNFRDKMEVKSQAVDLWLSKNRIPMGKKSEIMETVRQELERDRDVDVENILCILPNDLQKSIKNFMQNIKKKDQEVDFWLHKNGIPMHTKSEIMEKIQQELEVDRVVNVEDMLSIFPSKLQVLIKGCIKKMEDKGQEVHDWLNKNHFPMHKKSEIMKKVQKELQEERDVDVKNILSILPSDLRKYIQEFVHKVEERDAEVDSWLSKNGIPMLMKSVIMEIVLHELEKKREPDLENIISILPPKLRSSIASCLPLSRLKKVPLLKEMKEEVLKAICKRLVPKKYTDMDTITRENDSLKVMIFIVDGTVTIEKRKVEFQRSAGDFCGERLLLWPSSACFPNSQIPSAMETARASGIVEALVLMASDIESVGFQFKSQWNLSHSDKLTMLKSVPKLQRVDEEVVKKIAQHLKHHKIYKGSKIIEKNSPVKSIFFINEGTVLFDEGCGEKVERYAGEFYGEVLLDWVLDASFPEVTPLSTYSAASAGNAEILVLTAKDLHEVTSDHRSHFDTLPRDSQLDLSTFVKVTRLKNVPKLRKMDEEVLKAISERLVLKPCATKQFLLYGNEDDLLEKMFFVVSGVVAIQNEAAQIMEYRYPGEFYGEQLIDWALSTSSTSSPGLPKSRTFARCLEKSELLVLMASDLKNVVSEYRSHFS